MAQLLKLKRSSVSGKVPSTSNLEAGELAINTADGKLFFERDDSTVQSIFTTNALTTGSLRQSGSDSYFLSNVGIKTTNPSRALEVRGMILVSGSYENLADPAYAGLFFDNPQSGHTGLIRQQDSNGGLIFSSTECIIIKPNTAANHTGTNVAIFCTSSIQFTKDVIITDSNLTVSGSVYVSGSVITGQVGSSTAPIGRGFFGGESDEGIIFVTGTTSSLTTDAGGLTYNGEPIAYATGSPGYLAVFEAERKVTGSVVFQNTGKIGIGTTTPGAVLDVVGDLKVGTINAATTDTDTFLVSDSGTVKYRTGAQVLSDIGAQPAGNYVTDSGGAAGQLGVWSSATAMSGSNALYWTGTNLGVNTSTPSYKLEVKSGGANTFFTSFTPSGGSGFIRMYQDSNSHLSIYGANSAGTTNLVLATNGVSYLKGGNVIIGGSADNGATLQVVGNISGSNNLRINGNITGSTLQVANINYPTSDGTLNQAIVTDGAGNLSFGSVAASTAANTVITVKNVSGGIIYKGTPLYVTGSGTSGNLVGVWPADAGNPLRMPALCVAGEDLIAGAEGEGLLDGFIGGVNTSLFASGDEVYVAVGGGYTNVAPTGSGVLIQKLGNVAKVHASNGSGVINGPNAVRSLPNWETGKVMVGSPIYPVTSSFTYFDEANARLGIGTTAPLAKLDVISGPSQAGIASRNSTSGDTWFPYSNGINYIRGKLIVGDIGASDVEMVTGGGNVGIGTTSPNEKLVVEGNSARIKIQTAGDPSVYYTSLESNYNAGNTFNIIDGGSYKVGSKALVTYNDTYLNSYYNVYIATGTADNSSASNIRLFVSQAGNVAIGHTAPTAKLHVSGASATINVDDQAVGTPGFKIMSGAALQASLTSNTANGNTTLYVPNGTLTLQAGETTFTGNLTVDGIVTAQEFHTEFVSASIVYQSGSTKFGDTVDDKHQFTGSIDIIAASNSGIRIAAGNALIGSGASGGDAQLIYWGGDVAYYGRSSLGGSVSQHEFRTGGTTRLTVSSSGYVGIGTTQPSQTLDVNGTALVRSGMYVGNWIQNWGDGGTGLYFETDKVSLRTNGGTQQLVVSGSSGYVGIGTTTPAYKLDVAGTGYFGGGVTLASTLYVASTLSANSAVNINGGNELALYNSSNNASMQLFNNAGSGLSSLGVYDSAAAAYRMYINTSGNVGIGTTSPAEKLEVSGSISLLKHNSIASNGITHYTNNYLYVKGGTAGAALIDDGGVVGFYAQDAASAIIITNGLDRLTVSSTGAARLHAYGSGTFTGTPAKSLAVDSSGNIIETAANIDGSGAATQVTYWVDSNTITGSGDFTWDGTTLSINGILEANEKSFVIDHPLYDDKKLVYGVLEGPEHAVYCRGKINGNVIELPEEWTGLVDEDSITVQLTSIGKHQNLYVVDIRDNKVFIKNGDLLTSKINAFYYVQGTRKDIKPLETIRQK